MRPRRKMFSGKEIGVLIYDILFYDILMLW